MSLEKLPPTSDTYNTCLVLIEDQKIQAGLTHLGRGRYKIEKHDGGQQHVGKIIDASNIIHCRICNVCKDEWLPKNVFKTLRCVNCNNLIL